jgi:hypothetical protein
VQRPFSLAVSPAKEKLPFILNDIGGRIFPFLDTTKIHAESALAQMLS